MKMEQAKCLECEDDIYLMTGPDITPGDNDGDEWWVHAAHPSDHHNAVPQCPHTLGPIEHCTICNGREKAQQSAVLNNPRTWGPIDCDYPGICQDCRRPVHKGESIRGWRDGGMAHEECP